MKLTINLDEGLLSRVLEVTGAKTKTEAIHMALREVDRRARLTEILKEGLGADSEELKRMFDETSDPSVMRVAEEKSPYQGGKQK